MTVYTSDGEKLGKVLQCEAETFIIEKGFFFPKDYIARYDDIADVTNDEIRLTRAKDAFAGERDLREADTIGARSSMGGESYGRGGEMRAAAPADRAVEEGTASAPPRVEASDFPERPIIKEPLVREEPVIERRAAVGEVPREEESSVPGTGRQGREEPESEARRGFIEPDHNREP